MNRILLTALAACAMLYAVTGCSDIPLLNEEQDVHLQPVGEYECAS